MMTDARHEQFIRHFLSCQTRIYAFIRSLVFARADADDIFQETALVLWGKFDQFEEGTHFDRWAYRIAHLQVMYFRQKKARDRLQFGDDLIEQLAIEGEVESDRMESTREALSACLDDLPSRERELLRRRYGQGCTNRDLARVTGRSESAISRALSRIYLTLMLCIEGKLAQADPPTRS